MNSSHYRATSLLLIITLFSLTGCFENQPRSNWKGEVEVSPNTWLAIEGQEGRAWFRCQWNGKTVYWPGNYIKGQSGNYDIHLPISLRSWEGRLYLIYQQLSIVDERTRMFFCELDATGTRFIKMDRGKFPRQVATQNFGVDQDIIAHDENNQQVILAPIIRKLDVGNRYFHITTTALIWQALERGLAKEEIVEEWNDAMKFYSAFSAKYKPVPLPTIVK